MTVELLQDAIVTAVALAASAIVARRVFGFVATKDTGHDGCEKCASSPSTRARGAASDAATNPSRVPPATVHPLVVIRRSTSSRSTSA